jgi:hypothetical protein
MWKPCAGLTGRKNLNILATKSKSDTRVVMTGITRIWTAMKIAGISASRS